MENVYKGSFCCWADVVNAFNGATYDTEKQKLLEKAGL